MTQLLIAGTETVLPTGFSCTVKRENSFFTKSGEYTYDVTLRLDNHINQRLYGFLHRLNKTEQVATDRSATLIADGHVYCRGKEVITRWTEDTVTIQIVSGESELNYFIGQDQKIEDLDLGEINGSYGTYPACEYCMPTLRNSSGQMFNVYTRSGMLAGRRTGNPLLPGDAMRPQPYLCAILKRLIAALGYNQNRNMVCQLDNTLFANLFIVNTLFTTEFAKMLPGWTVKDFLTEVEKLTGVVFVTDNSNPENPTCDIYLKSTYYYEARQLVLNNVVDAYEANVEDDDSREAEFTTSDVSYDLPDNHWCKLMKLPEDFLGAADVHDYNDFNTLVLDSSTTSKMVLHDTSTDRYYIKVTRDWENDVAGDSGTDTYFIEIDQMKDLDRENCTSTLEIGITPAPMANLGRYGCEVIDLGTTDGYKSENDTSSDSETEESSEDKDAEQTIRDFAKQESSAIDLYCAFHNGTVQSNGCPVVYTDAYHAMVQQMLNPIFTLVTYTGVPEGSLRLKDLDAAYYQGGYEIDTRHPITFETYDPNVIDPRQVYVIRNRRYVCRDVEEVITDIGRQKRWKLTCYPIVISDEAIEKRWVLTKGVWDDGAAWLDDGRWNDE